MSAAVVLAVFVVAFFFIATGKADKAKVVLIAAGVMPAPGAEVFFSQHECAGLGLRRAEVLRVTGARTDPTTTCTHAGPAAGPAVQPAARPATRPLPAPARGRAGNAAAARVGGPRAKAASAAGDAPPPADGRHRDRRGRGPGATGAEQRDQSPPGGWGTGRASS
ncbi:hypothetical protein GCM10010466_53620 [Planomonospora alba]|uniref:Uncharacterized protein n=1 Tax=Planomonospora alba TaxID=161354 RepID=A0ABP6NSW3_9ACTN